MTEIEYALALKMLPGVGDMVAKLLINACGNASGVFNKPYNELVSIPGVSEKQAQSVLKGINYRELEIEIERIQSESIQIFYYKETNYPLRLKSFPDAPFLFFGKGNLRFNPQRIIGIVGTRKNSEFGKDFTQHLVQSLSNTGCTIISGLAIGIDSIAHQEALKNNLPTIGVLGSGILNLYPTKNLQLAMQMEAEGGVISEFFSLVPPLPENFPKRNRIVAGMCDALVVVETSMKGGAKITAEIANSYNKDVFALPGRPADYNSLGCNYLIRQNKAVLINQPDDLLTDLGWKDESKQSQTQLDFDFNLIEKHADIIAILMQEKRIHFDSILYKVTSEDASTLSMKLLELEFSGVIRQLPGKLYEMR